MRASIFPALLFLVVSAFAESPRSRFISAFLGAYAVPQPSDAPDPRLARTLSDAALEQTQVPTVYDPAYVKLAFPGGDVAPGRGVCTDVIIRAYRRAGIDLQVEVNRDMKAKFSAYPAIYGRRSPDANIDHRRVPNLMVFFSRHGRMLPLSERPADYLPGDVVAWDLGGGVTHIGLVVDRTGRGGRPWIVHNIGAGPKLEDVLFDWRLIGHFRYGPSLASRPRRRNRRA
ncbi:MAG: DUF1287 domain-containing protein [Elusimicrobia bacterium]|nr:DUF1287 domain-containing protein [Elusimicrobiota bacterium]